jgi:hypothetical protein
MDTYTKILLFLIIVLFLYWCYKKYTQHNNKQTLQRLSESIKNNITITPYNMNQFINISKDIKNILLNIAIKYKHEDIINLLSNKKN